MGEGGMERYRVLMFCAAGMSSSLLATKTMEAAKDKGVELQMTLLSAAEVNIYNFDKNPVDLVLIAPQVRFKKRSITKTCAPYGIPVEDIDTVTFGMVDGKKLFEQIARAVRR